ncbi:MAG: carbon storage regulator [Candidatus Pacearchaeota archaeon]|jgi:carbon storage regulator
MNTKQNKKTTLVLTRREFEKIIIGDHFIDITVVAIKGRRVKISITADENLSVHREEIFDQINEQNEQNEYDEQNNQGEQNG